MKFYVMYKVDNIEYRSSIDSTRFFDESNNS